MDELEGYNPGLVANQTRESLRQTTIHFYIHTYGQFQVFTWLNMYVKSTRAQWERVIQDGESRASNPEPQKRETDALSKHYFTVVPTIIWNLLTISVSIHSLLMFPEILKWLFGSFSSVYIRILWSTKTKPCQPFHLKSPCWCSDLCRLLCPQTEPVQVRYVHVHFIHLEGQKDLHCMCTSIDRCWPMCVWMVSCVMTQTQLWCGYFSLDSLDHHYYLASTVV